MHGETLRPADDSSRLRTRSAIRTLLQWYNHDTGLWSTTGWWNSANVLTVLADFSAIDPSLDDTIRPIFRNTFEKAQQISPGFLNDFYDDEGWWALAWLKVFDLNHEQCYLQMAVTIFEDMTLGWGGPCDGLWWNKTHTYTGAIENELFLAVAAQLANRAATEEYYIQWALKQWDWFQGTGMINAEGNINNGIDATSCKNDGQTVWTYNQGVILGALVELDRAAPDKSYLEMADRIALAAIKKLTDEDDILHEPGEPSLGEDGPQFKGIFVRNLQNLHKARPRNIFEEFLQINSESIWRNRGTNDQLGVVWSSPTEEATAATQSSACDALIAALSIGAELQ
ncbi:hypothetical protein MMC21_006823 [Puttea exsequens]|nr:hypothetical protein [Puttea exsequens]